MGVERRERGVSDAKDRTERAPGEMNMESVEEFLAYAIRLEQDAAERFGQLADAMESCGNRDVGRLFRRLSDY